MKKKDFKGWKSRPYRVKESHYKGNLCVTIPGDELCFIAGDSLTWRTTPKGKIIVEAA